MACTNEAESNMAIFNWIRFGEKAYATNKPDEGLLSIYNTTANCIQNTIDLKYPLYLKQEGT